MLPTLPSARIVCRITPIPSLPLNELELLSNFTESPEFTEIRERSRKEAIERLTTDPVLQESAVFSSAKAFDRYTYPQDIIDRLGECLGLYKPMGRIQRQLPGAMAVMHMDDLRVGYIDNFEGNPQPHEIDAADREVFEHDPDSVIRFLIPLQDSLPGQGFVFHETVINKWKAGDVIAFNWRTVPHATYNASLWPRDLIRISGFRSKRTNQLLMSVPEEIKY